MEQFGRLLIAGGVVLVCVGALLAFGWKLPLGLNRLNFHYRRDHFSFYFPLGASILISVILTLVFALLNRR